MTDESEAPSNTGGTGAGFEPIATFLRDALDAQGQAMSLAQNWALDIMSAYRDQAEQYNAMLQAVNRSLQAMEELVESQTRTTRALAESLDASHQLIDTAVASNQKSLERVESLVTGTVEQVSAQMKAMRHQAQRSESMAVGPLSAQTEAYLKLTRGWMDALSGFGGGAPARHTDSEGQEGS